MSDETKDLINSKEAAEILGVSTGRVRQIAQRGYLNATHIGRDWVFRRVDIEAFKDTPSRKPGRPANFNLLEKAIRDVDQWRNIAVAQQGALQTLIDENLVDDRVGFIKRDGWYLGLIIQESTATE